MIDIQAGKSYRTRAGRRVDVIAVLDEPDYTGDQIIGLLIDTDGEKEITSWKAGGTYDPAQPNCRLDIVGHLVPKYGHHNNRVFIVGGPEIAKVYTDEFAQKIVDALNVTER